MRRINLGLFSLVLTLITGCGKNDCEHLSLEVIAKADVLNATYAQEDCIAYKEALRAYIVAGCDGAVAYSKELEGLVCP